MCIVAKFGGTSLQDAPAYRQVIDVLRHHNTANVVIASAMSGMTNTLLALADAAVNHRKEEIKSNYEVILDRHRALADDIRASALVREEMESLLEEIRLRLKGMALLQEVSDRARDLLLSLGERLSSLLLAEALNQEGMPSVVLDARQLIITNSQHGRAEPEPAAIQKAVRERVSPYISAGKIVVTQGFIGATSEGETTTLGRGGSDYSAALIAEALDAEELRIWTDVAGIYSCDPSLVESSQVLPELSFAEAAEMATFGAKVLHPATLWPAVRSDIPVFVGSTFEPSSGGTWIRAAVNNSPLVRAIVVRKNQTLLTASNLHMFQACGFLAKFFEVLARHHISVDLVTTSEVKVSITIDNPELLTQQVFRELSEVAQIEVEERLALVGIIGHGLTHESGFISHAFSSLSDSVIRLICCGASDRNVCFLVDEDHSDDVVREIHKQLIEDVETVEEEVVSC